jgi:ADP-ribosyl-[dinitrogen reductase] hydrolase
MPPSFRKKLAGPQEPPHRRGRSRGALLGLAVGDALGATQEFRRLQAPGFPTLCKGLQTEITGGGPHGVRPGQVTDDTQMATALATSLRLLGRFDGADVARRYVEWLPHAFDAGNLTREALGAYHPMLAPQNGGRSVWLRQGKAPAGNGSLMRTAPIGVYFAKDRKARIQASIEDSAITHFDPRCQLACAALNAAIASAILGPAEVSAQALHKAALAELPIAAATVGRLAPDCLRELSDASASLKEDLAAAEQDDPLLYGPELHLHSQEGFVRVAFRLAFWELLHAPSFEEALIDVVNRGGDSDTNGAITGALLGAVHGEEAIPSRWRAEVMEAVLPPGPLADAYHPRQLLHLVE